MKQVLYTLSNTGIILMGMNDNMGNHRNGGKTGKANLVLRSGTFKKCELSFSWKLLIMSEIRYHLK